MQNHVHNSLCNYTHMCCVLETSVALQEITAHSGNCFLRCEQFAEFSNVQPNFTWMGDCRNLIANTIIFPLTQFYNPISAKFLAGYQNLQISFGSYRKWRMASNKDHCKYQCNLLIWWNPIDWFQLKIIEL
jgi:hypothetical protein